MLLNSKSALADMMAPMGKVCFIGLLLVACSAGKGFAAEPSDIYVERTETGGLRFTDQPSQLDARLHRLAPMLEVDLPERLPVMGEEQGQPSVEILSPQDDEAIRSNQGELKIRAHLEARAEEGQDCGFLIDGELIGTSPDCAFELGNIDRGTHRLQVHLMDADGAVLTTSSEVRFHMLRHVMQRN